MARTNLEEALINYPNGWQEVKQDRLERGLYDSVIISLRNFNNSPTEENLTCYIQHLERIKDYNRDMEDFGIGECYESLGVYFWNTKEKY